MAVMQSVFSNYHTDLFQPLIINIAGFLNISYLDKVELKIIADHIRASCFMISDGVLPSNQKEGYVLRKIIRRAVYHGFNLGQSKPFFYQFVRLVVNNMADTYPELIEKQAYIESIIKDEEIKSFKVLSRGIKLINNILKDNVTILSGDVAFKLYDTHGIPFDLMVELCSKKGVTVDKVGFNVELEKQKQLI